MLNAAVPADLGPAEVVNLRCFACGAKVAAPLTSACRALVCANCEATVASCEDRVLVMQAARSRTLDDDYPDSVYSLLEQVEPKHFWFAERNKVIVSALQEVLGPLAGRSILDVGCGTGYVLAELERHGALLCGLDIHLKGLRIARKRSNALLLCESEPRVPFVEEFDAALLCDVIEHTQDDEAVLREAARAVKPGGIILVTVPAHNKLWSPLDEVSGHKRRYSRDELMGALRRAGLEVRLARYFNGLLLPAQFVARRLQLGSRAGSLSAAEIFRRSLIPPREPVNSLLRMMLRADLVLSRMPVTFGSSLLAIARR